MGNEAKKQYQKRIQERYRAALSGGKEGDLRRVLRSLWLQPKIRHPKARWKVPREIRKPGRTRFYSHTPAGEVLSDQDRAKLRKIDEGK